MCGQRLRSMVIEDDHRERLACSCGYILYENPKVLVACFAVWQEKILWIKRATEPRKGLWAQPAGYMELGETPEQAAIRELFEETGASVIPASLRLFVAGSLPQLNEVYLVYRGELETPQFAPTAEAESVGLFSESEAPWEDHAYPEVEESIKCFYKEHRQRRYGVYSGSCVDGVTRMLRITP